MCDLARLAAAIRDASPEDAGSLETLQQEILASAEDDVMNHTGTVILTVCFAIASAPGVNRTPVLSCRCGPLRADTGMYF